MTIIIDGPCAKIVFKKNTPNLSFDQYHLFQATVFYLINWNHHSIFYFKCIGYDDHMFLFFGLITCPWQQLFPSLFLQEKEKEPLSDWLITHKNISSHSRTSIMGDSISGPRLYSCCKCRNHVALHDDIVSKGFQVNSEVFLA